MPRLSFIEKNEDAAKDLDTLGRLPDGEYEEWFGGWDVFPGLDSLKRAQTHNANCVYARYDGVPEEVTITDGATIGFGGSEDPRNPNWHTHKEKVCSDKSGIWEGDTVSFTVRHNGKSVKLKGKVIEKEYDGKWDKGGESSSWGRPTCSFTIRLTPKTIENAIAKLEGTSEAKIPKKINAPGSMDRHSTVDYYTLYEIDKDGDELDDIASGSDKEVISALEKALGENPKGLYHIVALWKENGHTESEVVWSNRKGEGLNEGGDLRTYCLDIWTALTKDMGKSGDEADRLINMNPAMIDDCWNDGVGPVEAARRVADERKSEAVLNRITMKEVRKVLDKLQKDGQLDKALHEITALSTYAGNHIANTDPDVTDNKLNAPERKIVTRAVLAHIAAQFGYQPEDLR